MNGSINQSIGQSNNQSINKLMKGRADEVMKTNLNEQEVLSLFWLDTLCDSLCLGTSGGRKRRAPKGLHRAT